MNHKIEQRGDVLVAIMNNLLDLAVAQNQGWYRIPVSSVENWLKKRWPPKWLAFYQTKLFGEQAYSVRYYAQVIDIQKAFRYQLFPNDPIDEKSQRLYFKLILSPLQQLPKPIFSRRLRRIVFIQTTWDKFTNAFDINDLYDDSPLEDRMWAAFKRLKIYAERQELVTAKDHNYFLDFAIYCALGKIDVETDGDTWHADPERIPLDNLRDNSLETVGWRVLRFNTYHIREEMDEYCIHTVTENINRLGGLEEGNFLPRKIDPNVPTGARQLTFSDVPSEDEPS